jgi:antitoxin ParD1/3/4
MIKAYFVHVAYKYILNHKILACRGTSEMKLITLYLPEPYIKALDQLVNEKFYPNRAEAIRVAIRDMINTEVWRRNTVA